MVNESSITVKDYNHKQKLYFVLNATSLGAVVIRKLDFVGYNVKALPAGGYELYICGTDPNSMDPQPFSVHAECAFDNYNAAIDYVRDHEDDLLRVDERNAFMLQQLLLEEVS